MGIEVPDYNRVVTLVGQQTDGTPIIVQLDNAGRIVAVIQGAIEGITGNVTVEQDDSVREVQGAEGATLRTLAVDASGQLVMVPRGQSGNYMSVDASGFLTSVMKGSYSGAPVSLAVDANGNIVALMQGEYSGTLKTIATDADGRVIMIPTDPADVWGNAIDMGNAELAACLGPAKRFDRRGQVYHLDTFDDGVRGVSLDTLGSGSEAVLSSERARTGAYSIKATHGGATASYAGFYTNLPHYLSALVGVEISWTKNAWTGYVTLLMTEYESNTYYSYGLRWQASDGDIQYLGSAGSWVSTGTALPLYTTSYSFNAMKLVVDSDNHEYVRWLLDNVEGSLSGVSPATGAQSTEDHLHVAVRAYGTASGAAYVYFDDLIITQNEPA